MQATRVKLNATAAYLIKDVVVSLADALRYDSRLFQQEIHDLGANNLAVVIELDLDELAEATRVVIAQRLGITKGLEKRVGLEHALFQLAKRSRLVVGRVGVLVVAEHRLAVAGRTRKVLHDDLGGFGLTGTTLTTDDDTLVGWVHGAALDQVHVRLVSERKDVRRQRAHGLAKVFGHIALAVGRIQRLVRVDRDQDRADVRVDHLVLVASTQVLEQRRLGQVGHLEDVLDRDDVAVGRVLVLLHLLLHLGAHQALLARASAAIGGRALSTHGGRRLRRVAATTIPSEGRCGDAAWWLALGLSRSLSPRSGRTEQTRGRTDGSFLLPSARVGEQE